jgi:hypothetical protein
MKLKNYIMLAFVMLCAASNNGFALTGIQINQYKNKIEAALRNAPDSFVIQNEDEEFEVNHKTIKEIQNDINELKKSPMTASIGKQYQERLDTAREQAGADADTRNENANEIQNLQEQKAKFDLERKRLEEAGSVTTGRAPPPSPRGPGGGLGIGQSAPLSPRPGVLPSRTNLPELDLGDLVAGATSSSLEAPSAGESKRTLETLGGIGYTPEFESSSAPFARQFEAPSAGGRVPMSTSSSSSSSSFRAPPPLVPARPTSTPVPSLSSSSNLSSSRPATTALSEEERQRKIRALEAQIARIGEAEEIAEPE